MWRFALAALTIALTGPANAQTSGEAEADAIVVYRDATLIDGAGGPPREHVSIVTQGPIIRAIIAAGEPAPEGADVVDASGLYALPGLIDAHIHIATPPDAASARASLRRQLYAGVTAVRVMADDLRSVAELSREARLGEISAPDIYFAALMAGPSFFEDPRSDGSVSQIDDLDAYSERLAAEIERRRALGVSASGERADTYPFVVDLRGPGQFYDLAERLRARGHSRARIEKILGRNFLRFARDIWGG